MLRNRAMASSVRAAGGTGAGPEVPGAKETEALPFGERARAAGRGVGWRAECVGGVADKGDGTVPPVGSATARERPLEEDAADSVDDEPVLASSVVPPCPPCQWLHPGRCWADRSHSGQLPPQRCCHRLPRLPQEQLQWRQKTQRKALSDHNISNQSSTTT